MASPEATTGAPAPAPAHTLIPGRRYIASGKARTFIRSGCYYVYTLSGHAAAGVKFLAFPLSALSGAVEEVTDPTATALAQISEVSPSLRFLNGISVSLKKIGSIANAGAAAIKKIGEKAGEYADSVRLYQIQSEAPLPHPQYGGLEIDLSEWVLLSEEEVADAIARDKPPSTPADQSSAPVAIQDPVPAAYVRSRLDFLNSADLDAPVSELFKKMTTDVDAALKAMKLTSESTVEDYLHCILNSPLRPQSLEGDGADMANND